MCAKMFAPKRGGIAREREARKTEKGRFYTQPIHRFKHIPRLCSRVLQKEIFNYLKTCSKSLMSWRLHNLLVHALAAFLRASLFRLFFPEKKHVLRIV